MSQAVPQTCELLHAGFRKLSQPVFRLSEGARVASMVIQLDSQEAVLPLRSLAREFKIENDGADGQMLNLIEKALDFVVAIRLGDKLPSELIGGEASWDPNDQDRRIATSRIRHNLVRSVFARTGKTATIKGGTGVGWEEEPQNRDLLSEATADMTTQIDGTDAAEITARVAALSQEMAYIETLRRTLTRGVTSMRDKLLRVPMEQVPVSRQETVKQVQALARRGLTDILNRFDNVDVRLDDMLPLLRDTAAAIGWLRGERDWLFRTENAWKAIFNDWTNAPNHYDDFLWKVVERSYAFLAPRFLSFQEWKTQDSGFRKEAVTAKVW